MKSMLCHRTNFFTGLFEDPQSLPSIITGVGSQNGQARYFSRPHHEMTSKEPDMLVVLGYVPDYMKIDYPKHIKLHCRVFPQEKGYAIDLTKIHDLDSYLKERFKNNARNIPRFVNRLEIAFTIRYQFYHGEIDDLTYTELMSRLKEMIIGRFEERNEQSIHMHTWEATFQNTLPLIRSKRASIFVIYDELLPIEISVNYHCGDLFFSSMSSYDTDYSKFGLGHVEIYKQLQWCLANNYGIFEMGWGYLDYKRRWCNRVYDFQKHLIYPDHSVLLKLLAVIERLRIRLKNQLIAWRVHLFVKRLKKIVRPKKKEFYNKVTMHVPESGAADDKIWSKEVLNWSEEYPFLRRYVYDYLYSSQIHRRNVRIYTASDQLTFLITGGREGLAVQFDQLPTVSKDLI